MKHLKKFENWSESDNIIDWPSEFSEEDIRNYEDKIETMLSLDDLDERMVLCDEILSEIEEQYPEYYDDLEDEIKDLTIG